MQSYKLLHESPKPQKYRFVFAISTSKGMTVCIMYKKIV